LGKLYQMGASVLLLGVDYTVCTAFHLAEYRYKEPPDRVTYECVVSVDGRSEWQEYEDVVLDDTGFAEIGKRLEEENAGKSGADDASVKQGYIGEALSRLIPMVLAVDYARDWMLKNRS
jgi:aminoglycoside 3-N-acetyltransferase